MPSGRIVHLLAYSSLQMRTLGGLSSGTATPGAVFDPSDGSNSVKHFRRLSVLAALCGAAACSSDRAYAPPGTVLTDVQVSRDLAQSAGSASAALLQEQDDYVLDAGICPASSTRTPAPSPTTAAPTAPAAPPKPTCSYNATTGRWSCDPFVNARGLTVTRSYAFIDAAGAPMQHYSDTATARINYQSESRGPVGDGVTFYGTTHRTSNQTASGLLGKETTRVWDGAGVSADTVTHRDSVTTRHYAGVRLDSLKGLTYVQPRHHGDYPVAGQTVQVANFTVTSTGRATETRSISRRVVTTYNGTALAKVETGSVTCTLHLDTRTVDGCTQH